MSMSESVVAADGYISDESSKVTDDLIFSKLGMLVKDKFSIQNPIHMDSEGHQDKLDIDDDEYDDDDDDDDDDDEYVDEDVDDDGHVLSFLYFSDNITYEEDRRHGNNGLNILQRTEGSSKLAFLRRSRQRNTIFSAILNKKQAAALEAHDKVAAICPAREIL